MSVELRGSVSIHRPGSVMFELGHNEFAGGFRWMIAADSGLRVPFQLIQRRSNTLAVGFADTYVTAYQSRQRDGLRSRESRVPTRAVFSRRDGFPVSAFILM